MTAIQKIVNKITAYAWTVELDEYTKTCMIDAEIYDLFRNEIGLDMKAALQATEAAMKSLKVKV